MFVLLIFSNIHVEGGGGPFKLEEILATKRTDTNFLFDATNYSYKLKKQKNKNKKNKTKQNHH
jgi:hypothetical protein